MITHSTFYFWKCAIIPKTYVYKLEKEVKACSDFHHSFSLWTQPKNETLRKWREIILRHKTQAAQTAQIPQEKLPSEGRQTENHNHRKLTSLMKWTTACLTQWNYEPCPVGPPKIDGSWWRILTKCGPLEKGMASHFSILALKTPWTAWKGKKIGHWDEISRSVGV